MASTRSGSTSGELVVSIVGRHQILAAQKGLGITLEACPAAAAAATSAATS